MFHGINTGLDSIFDRGCTVGMSAANLARRVRLLGGGAHFLDGELWSANFTSRAENAAAGDELHIAGPRLDLRSRCATHRIRPVRLVTKLPTVPTGHADDHATQHETGRRTQALLRCRAQGK